MIRFNTTYFVLALTLFVIEVVIALFVHDSFVRPYMGDFLVVILLYCLIRSFLNQTALTTLMIVLVFSLCVEFSQYLGLVHILGLEDSKLAHTIMGSSFSWADILAYISGLGCVYGIEILANRKMN
jgi:hypothetical protein